ncbi:MAG TPA: hypothetical protein VMT46_03925 [Anaerolineaceae bacterium]|nr:hypothetical protein [Anaerolineaceae bacterium]
MKRFWSTDTAILSWYPVAGLVGLGILASLPGYFGWFVLKPASEVNDRVILLLIGASGAASLLTALTSLALAVFLFLRKRFDRMALFVSFFLLGYGLIMSGPLEMLEYLLFGNIGMLSIRVQMFFVIPLFILLLTFPTATIQPARLRWLIPLILVIAFYTVLLSTKELDSITTLRSRFFYSILGLLFLTSFGSQIYRYVRISSPVQRQQTKLVVYGIGIWMFFMLLSSIPYYYLKFSGTGPTSQAGGILWWTGLLVLPVSLTLAVVRSHLWDIDVVIRRTLVYSLITASLSGVYFGSVIVLQALFSLLGSQRSPVVIVISTLIIAALFTPLRRRIQSLIDRRFYRQRYDAQQTLQAFSVALKNEIDLEQMAGLLVDVVGKTVEPESVSLWIREVKKA